MGLRVTPDADRVLLFDFDNTLIECAKYYIAVEDAFVKRTAGHTGLSEVFVRELVQTIDYESAKLHDGFNRNRFPRSFAAASLALDVISGHTPDTTRARQEEVIASLVFTADYTPYPGTFEAIQRLKTAGYRLGLVTKGDPDIQEYKLAKHAIRDLIDPSHIFIVPVKTKEVYDRILSTLKANPHKSWMIGDSLKDDIHPANELGMTTVHITDSHHPWRWEDKDAEATHVVCNVAELVNNLLEE